MRCFLFLACLFSLSALAAEPGEPIRVAAASDLRFALAEIAALYAKEGHPEPKLTFGSSGKFRTQILEGAPFDLFFSADAENPAALVQAGKNAGTPFSYARGRLQIWVKNGSPLKPDAKLAVLRDPSLKKIALANPTHAPYGRIAEEALKKAGLYETVKAKILFGEDISRTAQYVESGGADIGLIAGSLAGAPVMKEKGRGVYVDPALYTPLDQQGVVLKGPRQAAAEAFRAFFAGAASKEILRRYGLDPR